MTDLARQAAGLIANVSGSRGRMPIGRTVEILNSVGVLVSHEDAELLRQVKRLYSHEGWLTFRGDDGKWDGIARSSCMLGLAQNMKAALDAAGVPDQKGAE